MLPVMGAAHDKSPRGLRARAQGAARALLAALALTLGSAPADARADAPPFQVPPLPAEAPPGLAGELRGDVIVPITNDPLCPPGSPCLLRAGGGFGGSLELRWPRGLAAGVAYDAWFFNGRSVEELPSLQTLSVQVRYFFLPTRALHPFLGGAVGGALFGDRLRVDTGGMSLDALVGVEAERSARVAFSGAVGVRVFGLAPYTARDGIQRSQDVFANAVLFLRFGLVLQRF